MKIVLDITANSEKIQKEIDFSTIDKFVIGRGEADLSFSYDASLSRQHCSLFIKNQNQLWAKNHSQNGTLLNGQEIDEIQISDNDILQIGSIQIKVMDIDRSEENTVIKVAAPSPPIKQVMATNSTDSRPKTLTNAQVPFEPITNSQQALQDSILEARILQAWPILKLLSAYLRHKSGTILLLAFLGCSGIALALKTYFILLWINTSLAITLSAILLALFAMSWRLVASPFLLRIHMAQLAIHAHVFEDRKLSNPQFKTLRYAEDLIAKRCGDLENCQNSFDSQSKFLIVFNSAIRAISTSFPFLKKQEWLLIPLLRRASQNINDGLLIIELKSHPRNFHLQTVDQIYLYCQTHRPIVKFALVCAIAEAVAFGLLFLLGLIPMSLLGLFHMTPSVFLSTLYCFMSGAFAVVVHRCLLQPLIQIMITQKIDECFAGMAPNHKWSEDLEKLSPEFRLLIAKTKEGNEVLTEDPPILKKMNTKDNNFK